MEHNIGDGGTVVIELNFIEGWGGLTIGDGGTVFSNREIVRS